MFKLWKLIIMALLLRGILLFLIEMLTPCGQQHSFSTYELMFLWKCRKYRDRIYLNIWYLKVQWYIPVVRPLQLRLICQYFHSHSQPECGYIHSQRNQLFYWVPGWSGSNCSVVLTELNNQNFFFCNADYLCHTVAVATFDMCYWSMI